MDSILADVIAAVGGAEALGRHRSIHTKMEITFKGLGISGTAEHFGAAGDKALTITAIPNLASTREGSDGTRLWSEDPINGLRMLVGIEAEQARIEVAWNAELRMKELFPKIEVKNERSEDGTPIECLILTPKAGPPMTDCFDSKNHLMVVQRGVRSGPQGDMPFTARLSDWRLVNDMKMAFATEMQVGPLAFTGHLTSAELDVPLEPAFFAVPAAPAGAPGKDAKTRPGKKSHSAGPIVQPSGRAAGAPGGSTLESKAKTKSIPAPAPASNR